MSLERTDEETRPTNNAIGVIGNQEIKLNERKTSFVRNYHKPEIYRYFS
jgi:hypothetical protein